MVDLHDTDFPVLQMEYRQKFGELTFSPLSVPDDKVEYLVTEMHKAIAGERGEITDDELGADVPDEADA
ncbi:MAG: hypothetical protein OEZ10_11575 [Gammaproteobacteria bacterium]|nr:hypothetical protein [Gammaproteobacteria bacterium]